MVCALVLHFELALSSSESFHFFPETSFPLTQNCADELPGFHFFAGRKKRIVVVVVAERYSITT
jgi:hypothetical protein